MHEVDAARSVDELVRHSTQAATLIGTLTGQALVGLMRPYAERGRENWDATRWGAVQAATAKGDKTRAILAKVDAILSREPTLSQVGAIERYL